MSSTKLPKIEVGLYWSWKSEHQYNAKNGKKFTNWATLTEKSLNVATTFDRLLKQSDTDSSYKTQTHSIFYPANLKWCYCLKCIFIDIPKLAGALLTFLFSKFDLFTFIVAYPPHCPLPQRKQAKIVSCITLKHKIVTNLNFENMLILFISMNLCHKKRLLESLNTPLRYLEVILP